MLPAALGPVCGKAKAAAAHRCQVLRRYGQANAELAGASQANLRAI